MPFRLEIFIRQGTFGSFEARLPDIHAPRKRILSPKSQGGIVVFCTTPQSEVATAQGAGLQ